MNIGGTALVLGEDSRSCLAVVRSLGRKGVNVIFGVQTTDSVVPHSRYVTRTIKLPSTHREWDAWVSAVRTILEKNQVDVVVPCSDGVMIPLFKNQNLLNSRSKFAVPDEHGFEFSYFKDKTLALAQQLDVPIPASILLRSRADLSNFESSEDLRLPVVLKPVSSKVWKNGTRFDMRVSVVHDRATLARLGREMLQVQPLLVQEYFEGIGVGQEFLTRDGEILVCFQHERVHEPIGGGGSSYRKSVAVCDKMLQHSKRLLAHLKWTGAAMVEFRQNRATGEFVLMEINGRFWGSLPLAVAAGVDFPYELYKLTLNGEASGPPEYPLDLYSRNVQRDLRWFRERLQNPGSASRTGLVARELADAASNILRGRERWDEITLDDPIPGLFETLNDFRAIGERIVISAQSGLLKLLAVTRIWPALQRTRIRELLTVTPNLLFICRGNICRSPFAEAYASLQLESVGLNVRTASAGTHPLANREPPQVVCSVSREFGVNLDEHRSRVIGSNLIRWAGAVVCMDFQNYRELRTTFPEVRNKLFFLRPFDRRAADFRTRDPLGKPAEEFRIRFRQIALSVDGLVKALID